MLRYILYARKSTESDDRQVQSIDDQVRIMTEVAARYDLKVIKVLREAKSAKAPGNRPLFEQLMETIEAGQAEGILCWHANRLSRNPVDSGRISWLLQQSKLQLIQTSDRQYRPEDNVLIYGVESSMANQYVIDLSKAAKRGIHSKLVKGEWPGVSPVGYLNDRDAHKVIPDPLRFALIRKAWDEMLTGRHNVPAIMKKLNGEWGFRSVQRKRIGGCPIAISGLYKVFNNPFYKGTMLHEGVEYPGTHTPMVTEDEFDRVQVLLGRKSKHRVRKHSFSFTGLIRCGECGCLITAQEKKKLIKGTGEVRKHVYYNCTRRRVDIDCSQRKVIRLEDLEAQIEAEISKYTILPQFRNWALEVLRESNATEIETRSKQYESLQAAANAAQRKLDNLTKMRYSDLIGDEEFTRERESLQSEVNNLRSQLSRTESLADEWLSLTERVFDFAASARQAFLNGDSDTKRGILMALGQNPTLKDGKLAITPYKWLQPIADHYPAIEKRYKRLEPRKKMEGCIKSDAPAEIISSWQGH